MPAAAADAPSDPAVRLAPLGGAPLRPSAIARLLARAYEGQTEAGCFAPGGGLDGWEKYVEELFRGRGFGTPLPDASFAAWAPGEASPVGAIVVTSIGDATGHIAQLAVDGRWRKRGTGERLIQAALGAMREGGRRRVTLLVADSNGAARRLYARLGFEPCGEFVFAARSPVGRRRRG